jgi:release factor glutamine methyltransferase
LTLRQALRESAKVLSISGIQDSCIEARLLIGRAMNLSLVEIYTEPDQTISVEEKNKLNELLAHRLKREPSAYILNRKEFYGIDFYVDPRVLIPRPETELLVNAALECAHNRSLSPQRQLLVADIGTGCGAIAISFALSWSASEIYATDLSSSALEVAALNCRRHQVTGQIHLLAGDLLQPLPEPVDIIIANLPYIRKSDIPGLIPEIARFEPHTALDGGESGLDCIESILQQVDGKINAGGCVLLEIGQHQEKEVGRLIRRYLKGATFSFTRDHNGTNRVVKIAL